MVVQIKKTYRSTRIFIFGAVFYFLFMARLSNVEAADIIDNCVAPLNNPNTTYNLTADIIAANCVVAADGVIIDGTNPLGGKFTINGKVSGNGSWGHYDGYDFTIQNVNVAGYGGFGGFVGVTAIGAYGSGNGGNITIKDSSYVYGSVAADGAYGSGSNGGNVTITSSEVAGTYGVVSSLGGGGNGGDLIITNSNMDRYVISSAGGAIAGAGGHGGDITIQNSTLYNAYSTGGSSNYGAGGAGGEINIIGGSTIYNADSSGGYSNPSAGGAGGDINIISSTVHYNAHSDGGPSSLGLGVGGASGNITITNSNIYEVNSIGGTSYGGGGSTGGIGGNIIITASSVVDEVHSFGGYSASGVGGNAGNITITDSIINTEVQSVGGLSFNAPTAGASGGDIIIDNLDSGGAVDIFSIGSISTTGVSGDGGDITIRNNSYIRNAVSSGGNSAAGGSAGTVIIDDSIFNVASSYGGSSINSVGGGSGNITVENSNGYIAFSLAGHSHLNIGGASGNVVVNNSILYSAMSSGGASVAANGGNSGEINIENSTIILIDSEGGYSTGSDDGNGGNVFITNSDIDHVINSGGTVDGTLTITDDPPTVVLNGNQTVSIHAGDPYTELGATASDTKYIVTPLAVTTTGTVDTNTIGQYDITYTSDPDNGTLPTWNGVPLVGPPDQGVLPQTGINTRTVNVARRTSSGSGSYIQNHGLLAGVLTPTIPMVPEPSSNCKVGDLFSSTTGKVCSVSSSSTTSEIQKVIKNLKFGMTNNTDIKILQQFLINQNKGPAALALKNHGVTNNFGKLTKFALAEWQKVNNITPSAGYFGSKTRALIKLLNL